MGGLRSMYPAANLIGIDFEGGTAESNVANRLRLFISRARESAGENRPTARRTPEQARTGSQSSQAEKAA